MGKRQEPATKTGDVTEDSARVVLNRIFSKALEVKQEYANITSILSVEVNMKGVKNPYRKAYNNLRRNFKSFVELIDYNMESFNREVSKPITQQLSSNEKIVLHRKEGKIFMSCTKCDDWIDTTLIFSEGRWGTYICAQGHNVIFQLMDNDEQFGEERQKSGSVTLSKKPHRLKEEK